MKLLGAALILCGAALQCHALLGARRQERAALRELSAALEGLERGIRASLMPLPRLLGQRGAGKHADAFFADVLAQLENGTPLPDGWREAAARTPLGEREQAVLSGLADALSGEEDAVLRALRAAAHSASSSASSPSFRRSSEATAAVMTHSANTFSKSSIAQNPKSVLTSSKSELISRTSSIIVVTSPARLTSIA